jgi:hypothetical protein
VPFTEADTSLPPGAVINVTPGPGTTISPDDPVTITTNPGGGSGPQATLLHTVEQGLIANNPDLVAADPEFEDETVPLVAEQCLKLVTKAQAAGPGAGGAVADESDCGSTTSRGLPMFVIGREAKEPAINDLAGLERNPSWVMLNRRIWQDLPGKRWYRNRKEPAPGCHSTTRNPPSAHCDEFPYWSTLQARRGSLQTLIPSIRWTPDKQNEFEGTALQQFYSDRNPGDSMWFHGCDLVAQPPTDIVPQPESTFLVLPLPLLPTTGICNKPTS